MKFIVTNTIFEGTFYIFSFLCTLQGSLVMSSIALLRFALGFNGSDKQQRVRLWHIVNGDSLQLFSPITRMHMKQNQQQVKKLVEECR